MINAQLLGELAVERRFLCYKLESLDGNGKMRKVPVNPWTGANSYGNYQQDQTVLATLQDAEKAVANYNANGVGIIVGAPLFVIDIDKCIDGNGNYDERAQQLIAAFPGILIEKSVSGTGLHLFGLSGNTPIHAIRSDQFPGVEFYSKNRFIALTGDFIQGELKHWDLTQFLPTYFPPKGGSDAPFDSSKWRSTHIIGWHPVEDDNILVQKILDSKPMKIGSPFNNTQIILPISGLINADPEILRQHFYVEGRDDGLPYDLSSVDFALAQALSWWTCGNHQRVYDLMWTTSLRRDKWRPDGDNPNYLQRTIMNACAVCEAKNNFYGNYYLDEPEQQQQQPQQQMVPGSNVPYRTGLPLLSVEQQHELFKDFCYVSEIDRIVTKNGQMYNQSQFNNMFGGYEFALSYEGKCTKKPWDAYMNTQLTAFPKADKYCFRPDMPAQQVFRQGALSYFNTYVPHNCLRVQGDPGPFLELIHKMFSDERDQRIFKSYIAALVQHIGVKFQWCPVVQGAQGNGKTTIGSIIEYAIGQQYTFKPDINGLKEGGFTGWLSRMLFICAEEVFVRDKIDLLNKLKPYITNDRVEINPKGLPQHMIDNLANWLIFTNFKNAIHIDADDRRYCPLYADQQYADDFERTGLGVEWWKKFRHWLNHENGYAICAEWLYTYPIEDEFNPAGGCIRPPVTSSTQEAYEVSLPYFEGEVLHAVESDVPGFRDGWISSFRLDELIKSIHYEQKIPRRTRGDKLRKLGYIRHPALEHLSYNKGRATQNVMMEQGNRPILYIRKDSPYLHLTDPHEATNQYILSNYPQPGG